MMASSSVRFGIRIVFLVVVLLLIFYVGRPLYWKLSATFQEIREKSVKDGFSHIVSEAQKSLGWHRDASDAGVSAKSRVSGAGASRRLLHRL